MAMPAVTHRRGLTTIADGKLLDLIRKLDTFGAHLVTLDVRQESTRHSDLMEKSSRWDWATIRIGAKMANRRFSKKKSMTCVR